MVRVLLVLVDPRPHRRRRGGAHRSRGASRRRAGATDRSFVSTALAQSTRWRALRANAPGIPVALFPGSAMQLTDQVDLVLLPSLVSGRNPQILIEEHVRAVPYLPAAPVPTLSTA